MARYKEYSYDQILMVPVSFEKQILPGSFEYTLCHLIDHQIDMSIFDYHYDNDDTGAPAYDPAILLKVILFAYSRGINSSRKIEKLCEENIICMALAADTRPHFTTIADFISSRNEEISALFTMILSVCYSEGLIGKNMFAIDGCKISSNCSKEWSSTKDELLGKTEKIRKSVNYLLEKHKKTDKSWNDQQQLDKEDKAIKKLNMRSEKILQWLDTHEEKRGSLNQPIKSNVIDNDSAKMSTGHGVIQGYNGIATVDDKHQLIVWAEAFGDANESGHLPEILEGVEKNCSQSGIDKHIYKKVIVTADTGFHNKKNMTLIHDRKINAYIPDNLFRKRQVAFSNAGRYKKNVANWKPEKRKHYFRPEDFHMDTNTNTLICPAGHPMILKCPNFQSVEGHYIGKAYRGQRKYCGTCSLRSKCIRHEHTPYGRSVYSRRMGTVEPVFGHLSGMKKPNRFTLRSKKKVNSQWLLYCMVHNIGKIKRYGA